MSERSRMSSVGRPMPKSWSCRPCLVVSPRYKLMLTSSNTTSIPSPTPYALANKEQPVNESLLTLHEVSLGYEGCPVLERISFTVERRSEERRVGKEWRPAWWWGE